MSELAVERCFSVAAEMADGTKTLVRVTGETPAEAFKQVRERPDVRRVGKVTEIQENSFRSGSAEPGREPMRPVMRSVEDQPPQRSTPPVSRESLIGFTISGPRVVRDARRVGGEQPFKHLQAPPPSERDAAPVEPPKPIFSPFGASPKPPAPAPVEAVEPVAVESPEEPSDAGVEYRIVKSRRKDGFPYLLQRGSWQQQAGKRVFHSEWEKGFPDRDQADQRREWLEEMMSEPVELEEAEAV